MSDKFNNLPVSTGSGDFLVTGIFDPAAKFIGDEVEIHAVTDDQGQPVRLTNGIIDDLEHGSYRALHRTVNDAEREAADDAGCRKYHDRNEDEKS